MIPIRYWIDYRIRYLRNGAQVFTRRVGGSPRRVGAEAPVIVRAD
jgi:hypothetical protein